MESNFKVVMTAHELVNAALEDIRAGGMTNPNGESQSNYLSFVENDNGDCASLQITKESAGIEESERFYSIHLIDNLSGEGWSDAELFSTEKLCETELLELVSSITRNELVALTLERIVAVREGNLEELFLARGLDIYDDVNDRANRVIDLVKVSDAARTFGFEIVYGDDENLHHGDWVFLNTAYLKPCQPLYDWTLARQVPEAVEDRALINYLIASGIHEKGFALRSDWMLKMYRDDMTRDEEVSYVKYLFELYEEIGFAEVFRSNGGDFSEYDGTEFTVLSRVEDNIPENLPKWNLHFGGGKTLSAYPDEIIPTVMRDRGANPNKENAENRNSNS